MKNVLKLRPDLSQLQKAEQTTAVERFEKHVDMMSAKYPELAPPTIDTTSEETR